MKTQLLKRIADAKALLDIVDGVIGDVAGEMEEQHLGEELDSLGDVCGPVRDELSMLEEAVNAL